MTEKIDRFIKGVDKSIWEKFRTRAKKERLTQAEFLARLVTEYEGTRLRVNQKIISNILFDAKASSLIFLEGSWDEESYTPQTFPFSVVIYDTERIALYYQKSLEADLIVIEFLL
ncbi:MAG: hypothetical protein ACFFC7_08615 [Candidatus Hermodarchaeota archaeon]